MICDSDILFFSIKHIRNRRRKIFKYLYDLLFIPLPLLNLVLLPFVVIVLLSCKLCIHVSLILTEYYF